MQIGKVQHMNSWTIDLTANAEAQFRGSVSTPSSQLLIAQNLEPLLFLRKLL